MTCAFLLTAKATRACTCNGPLPPCEAYQALDAIFIATATDIDPPDPARKKSPQVHFTIERAFKGITDTKIEMWQGTGSGDCSLPFEKGKQYLIYAYYDSATKQFGTNSCTRTTPIEFAAEDLDFLSGLPESSRGNRLTGLVALDDYYDSPEDQSIPELLGGVAVSAIGDNGKRFEAVTNSQGFYKIVDLPPGRYKLEAKLPSYVIRDRHVPDIVEVPKTGCATAVVLTRTDGRLSGVLLDARGQSVPETLLELVPFALSAKLADRGVGKFVGRVRETDKDGRFEFSELKPGRYVLGVNIDRDPDGRNPYRATFFPGVPSLAQAKIITLARGEKLKGIELRLPGPLPLSKISGVVVWRDGRPVADAHLDLKNTSERIRGRSLGSAQTDKRGRFTLRVLQGQQAWLHYSVLIPVEHGLDVMEGSPIRIVTTARHRSLRLVITHKGPGGLEILPFPH